MSGSEVNASERATTPIGTDVLVGRAANGPPSWSHKISALPPPKYDQQGRPGTALDQRQAAQQRQERLLLVVQDFELDPGSPAYPRQELRAVGSAAAGFGLATQRASLTPCRAMIRADTRSAAMVRAIAPWLSQPCAARPSPRRTIREKLSITSKPSGVRSGDQQTAVIGPQIESRQRLRAPPL